MSPPDAARHTHLRKCYWIAEAAIEEFYHTLRNFHSYSPDIIILTIIMILITTIIMTNGECQKVRFLTHTAGWNLSLLYMYNLVTLASRNLETNYDISSNVNHAAFLFN